MRAADVHMLLFVVSSPLSTSAWTKATTALGVIPPFGAAPELGTKTSSSLIVEQEEVGARATFSEAYAHHFLRFFQNTERICDEVAIEEYKDHRLGQVQATTVRGELSALRCLQRWMKKRKPLSALPKVPKRAAGTSHKLGRRKVVKLSPEDMDAILAHLPEVTRKGYPVREFVTFVRETSLRPSTAELIAQATEMIGCGREDSCVTGMRQSRSGHSPRSCRIPGAIRRPLTGAEYTVGRVLVDTYETFTENPVRKRGLVCDWNAAKSEWTQSTELPDSRCNTQAPNRGRVHRRSSPRRYV